MIYDRIEQQCWTDILSTPVARAAGASVLAIEGGAVLAAPSVDHVLFNRAIAIPTPSLDVALDALEAGDARWFLHIYPSDAAGHDWARNRGLDRYPRSWIKLQRSPGPIPEAPEPEGIRFREAMRTDATEIGALFCSVFDVPQAGVPLIAALVGRPGWWIEVAVDGTEIVGFGMLFSQGAHGYLAGGGTRQSHRQRGIQGALVRRRVQHADTIGLAVLTTETGEAKAGEAQHSCRNLERSGFREVSTRHNYTRTGTTWA